MPLISSPPTYPSSSSPIQPLETRKRPLPNEFLRPNEKRHSGHGWSKDNHYESLKNPAIDVTASYVRAFDVQEVASERCEAANVNLPSLNLKPPQLGNSVFKRHREVGPLPECGHLLAQESPSIASNNTASAVLDDLHAIERKSDLRSPDRKDTNVFRFRTTTGKVFSIRHRSVQTPVSYEQLIASRSATSSGKAQKSYYGVNIHQLLDQAAQKSTETQTFPRLSEISEVPQPSVESRTARNHGRKGRRTLWTEKYRARKFTDLVGDERTHRTVLRWLKGWDPIVFPGSVRAKSKLKAEKREPEERAQRKLLLLTGPPGLGKTTLAHVCARQAGFEVVEINASDERSRDVVKGRIRDLVGTENVKGVNTQGDTGTVRKAGRPVCVVVDEVDGVVGGNNGGEGGFIKSLMDLVLLDHKNTATQGASSGDIPRRSKNGDRFRLLRPIILICNDVYHPSLRPLRSSSMAEIIHIRRPPLDKVVARLKKIFDREGIACDADGVRRLCEASWGISSRREHCPTSINSGEGDIRGVLVIGEWVASKLRTTGASTSFQTARLTGSWVEKNMLENLSYGGGSARGVGRGGAREAVERVFQEGAGFPKSEALLLADVDKNGLPGDSAGVSNAGRQRATDRLRDIIDTSGETDRIMADCFAMYPSQPFQDDMYLTKPNAAYEWLHFHDTLSSKVHSGQEWELAGYLSQPTLGFHHLFASPAKHHSAHGQKRWDEELQEQPSPFSGPRADYEASEVSKQNKALLQGVQASLSIPLLQSFRSPEGIATDLVPHLNRLVTPNIKPIVVGGSGEQKGMVSVRKATEKAMLERAASVMDAVGVSFERGKVDGGYNGANSYVYRMEPPLDALSTFETAASNSQVAALPVRYAIRQALDQEHQKYLIRKSAEARQARYQAGSTLDHDGNPDTRNMSDSNLRDRVDESKPDLPRRDFFGRAIHETGSIRKSDGSEKLSVTKPAERKVRVSFHEGFSNAVRKPITLDELMRGF